MKILIKNSAPHIIAILAMFIVSSVYFSSAWDGQSLRRDDKVKSAGGASDLREMRKYEDKTSLWNSSRFSGMPDFLTPTPPSSSKLKSIYALPQKMGVPTEVAFLFLYMFGFYILLVCYGVNPWLSLGASIAFGLTSYNLIIIEAGHFKKVRTIALIAPTLAGILLILKRKYLYGFVLTAFFLSQQIAHEHIQMSYYFMLGLICIGIVELYSQYKSKTLVGFSKTLAVLFAALIFAIGPNFSKLYSTYRYSEYSIRGQGALSSSDKVVDDKGGLDKDYINAWSTGKVESMMLFAPRVKGGASAYIKDDKYLLDRVDRKSRSIVGNMNQYWGDQGYSGGPNHAGTVFITLFIIGLFVIKGSLKKGLLAATVLLLCLSWGKYFSVFTDLFVDYFPMYNKFRAPVSILAVAVIFIIFFGIYTLSEILKNPELLEHKMKIKGVEKKYSNYLVGGLGFVAFLVLGLVFPKLYNTFFNAQELDMFANYRSQGGGAQIDAIMAALEELRIYVFRKEFFRSLFFAAATVASLYYLKRGNLSKYKAIAIISLLAIVDIWGVSQRYVSNDNLAPRKDIIGQEYKLSKFDKQIYAREIKEKPEIKQKIVDAYERYKPQTEIEKENIQKYIIRKNAFYRVLNTTVSTFNDNTTSGAHRSIGGYSAAKLRRYQDLISHCIAKGNAQVLNMLNVKYRITDKGLVLNPNVNGAAWFVEEVMWASDRADEMAMLQMINTKKQVVVAESDKALVSSFDTPISGDIITLDYYEPDHMIYSSQTSGDRLAVFSEIFYPDWKILIDGKESKCFCANYVLRGLSIPEGEHKIEFIFHPGYYYKSMNLSLVFYYLLMGMIFISFLYYIYSQIRQNGIDENK